MRLDGWVLDGARMIEILNLGPPTLGQKVQRDLLHRRQKAKTAAFLLLSKPKRFLHGNRHFVVQSFMRLVRGEIEAVEARND